MFCSYRTDSDAVNEMTFDREDRHAPPTKKKKQDEEEEEEEDLNDANYDEVSISAVCLSAKCFQLLVNYKDKAKVTS